MTLDLTGRELGGYTLQERLGTGAAGQVYRAHDHRLDRDVAVKVLHPALVADPDRLQRFEREALAASGLAHPNIVHIYDVGAQDGNPFIVMEWVDGETLRSHLNTPPPVRQLVDWSLQLAEGLAKAHERDIVHRDLKPENVLVSRDGYVKIVDFGLAKLLGSKVRGEAASTAHGMVLGTAAYMSPEQAGGDPVDFRSDQFSFGSIVYELACGESAFAGDHFAATMAAVFRCEPEPLATRAPAGLPPQLLSIVDRCLAKNRTDRYPSTADLVRDLRELRDQVASGSSAPTHSWRLAQQQDQGAMPARRGGRWVLGSALGSGALLAAMLFTGWLQRDRQLPSEPRQLRRLVSAQLPDARARDPALSPDGSTFAFVGERAGQADLYVGRTDGGDHVRLTNDAARESRVMFSPEADRLVFARKRDGKPSEVCTIPTLGGPITTVITGASMPAFSPDGRRLAFVRLRPDGATALAVAGIDGSDERELLRSDGRYPFLYRPTWAPDGELIALRRSTGGFAGEIWLVPLDEGEPPRRLRDDGVETFSHDPVFTPDGRAVVVSSNRAGAANLWRLPIDGGAPQALTSGPGPDELPSMATTGAIVFASSSWRYSLRIHDLRTGETRPLLTHHSYLWAPHFAADGHTVAYSRAETDGSWHLSRVTLGGQSEALPADPRGAIYPRRFPGGDLLYNTWNEPRRLVRLDADGGARTLVAERAAGSDAERGSDGYGDPSPDGKQVAFARQEADGERVFVRPTVGGPATRLIDQPSTLPRWSPDGATIAFAADRSVHGGIFLAQADGRDIRRLTESGGWPVWWPDGERIGFLAASDDGNQEIRIVTLADGTIDVLDDLHFGGTNHPFDIAPDGQLLVTTNSEPLIDEIWLLEPASP